MNALWSNSGSGPSLPPLMGISSDKYKCYSYIHTIVIHRRIQKEDIGWRVLNTGVNIMNGRIMALSLSQMLWPP